MKIFVSMNFHWKSRKYTLSILFFFILLTLILMITDCKENIFSNPDSCKSANSSDPSCHLYWFTDTLNCLLQGQGPLCLPVCPVSDLYFSNMKHNGIVETGFLVGGAKHGIVKIEVSLDGGIYSPAEGSTGWSYKLPSGSSTWKQNSKHSIQLKATFPNLICLSQKITVRKGTNRDVNGDGYADLTVGARNKNKGAGPAQGVAYIFHSNGNPGINVNSAAAANSTISGQGGTNQFGMTLSLGDLNGDGYADLAVGANLRDAGLGGAQGSGYIFYSRGPSGINITSANSADMIINGEAAGDFFAGSSTIGDFNGDGYDDLVFGAYINNAGAGANQGSVYIYNGSSNGINYGTSSPAPAMSASKRISAPGASEQFGYALASGDINGDGFSDLIVGANIANTFGSVYIFLSPGNGGITVTSGSQASSIISANTATDNFGNSIAAEDINGDDFSDIAVGAYYRSSQKGYVYTFHSLGTRGITASTITQANATISGASSMDQFGFSVSLGDINGDGYSDLAVGANQYNGGNFIGRVYVFHSNGITGISSGIADTANNLFSGMSADGLGESVILTDINGDGYKDLVIGGQRYNNASYFGIVYILHSYGNTGLGRSSVTSANTTIIGELTNDYFGCCLR